MAAVLWSTGRVSGQWKGIGAAPRLERLAGGLGDWPRASPLDSFKSETIKIRSGEWDHHWVAGSGEDAFTGRWFGRVHRRWTDVWLYNVLKYVSRGEVHFTNGFYFIFLTKFKAWPCRVQGEGHGESAKRDEVLRR